VSLLVLPTTTSASSSPNSHPLNGQSTRRKRIPRTLQSWVIHHKAKPKARTAINASNKAADPPGSILTFSKPTKQNIANWFGVDEDPNQMIRCMLRKQFNHDSVGMTNPFLHLDSDDDCNLLLRVQRDDGIALPVSLNDDKNKACWWPSLSFPPSRKKQWRVLTYRRRVGTGLECYERVRDAALDWEFQTNDGLLGLLSVPSSSETQQLMHTPKNPPNSIPSPYGVRGRYTVTPNESEESEGESIACHRSIGSARRMVSFTASRLLPFLPKLYAVNPVTVVYDLMDQR
jgi:hypothetical protein